MSKDDAVFVDLPPEEDSAEEVSVQDALQTVVSACGSERVTRFRKEGVTIIVALGKCSELIDSMIDKLPDANFLDG
jgi:hypothetical protein